MRKKTIRQHRREKDLTQEQLSSLTGLSHRVISAYENDLKTLRSASYGNLEKIAKALDIKVHDIFLG